jgi:hypothetical protein
LADEQLAAVKRLAERVAVATGLLGWLQMDLVEDETGRLWLLEFNPRWASSMEILDACNHQPLEKHLAAFSDRFIRQSAEGPSYQTQLECACELTGATASKGIVYAGRDLMLEASQIERLQCLPRTNFADLPALEQCNNGRICFTAGQPVITVRNRATGDNLPRIQCRSSHLVALRELAEQFWLVTEREN